MLSGADTSGINGDSGGGVTAAHAAQDDLLTASQPGVGCAGLCTRGLMIAPASSAACSADSPAADVPKYVRAAASAP